MRRARCRSAIGRTCRPSPGSIRRRQQGVADIVQSLAAGHPEATAIILFGSVARREERPLDAPEPSDVDLLLLLDAAARDQGARRLARGEELALHRAIGEADNRHRSPREIKVLFAYRDLDRWDSPFLENVARDGILLWARGPLPAPLVPVAQRARIAQVAPDQQ